MPTFLAADPALAPVPPLAEAARLPPFQLADAYRLRRVLDIAMSPDGALLAFTVYGLSQAENAGVSVLWLAAADGSMPPRPLTSTAYEASAPAWAPDGRAVAFLSARPPDPARPPQAGASPAHLTPEHADPVTQVWLLPLGGGEPRQLTHRPEGVIAFDWAPDGTRLVVAARDPSPAQARYLASIRGQHEGAGGEAGPFVVTRVQHKWDGAGYLDNVPTHLFVVDVETGAATRITSGACDETEPRWSPAGDWIVFVSNRTGDADNNQRNDLWLVRPDGQEARRLTQGDLQATAPAWSPDGRTVACLASLTPDDTEWGQFDLTLVDCDDATPVADLATCVGDGWTTVGGVVPATVVGDPVAHAQVFPVPTGASPVRVLTAEQPGSNAVTPVWQNATTLLAAVADHGRIRLLQITTDGHVLARYPADDAHESLTGLAAVGETIALAVAHAESGADLALLRLAPPGVRSNAPAGAAATGLEPGGTAADAALAAPRWLTRLNAAVFADRVAPHYETIEYPTRDGQAIAAVVMLPPGFDPRRGPYPLVLNPHGGPMSFDPPTLGFYPRSYPMDHYLAGRGYIVLQPNYRGSTSYGRDFNWEIRDVPGQREYEDCLAGVDDLIGRGWADPERLFITGMSYGGFLTAWAVGRTDRFRAAVAEHAIWDWGLSVGAGDLHTYNQRDYGLSWQNPAAYTAGSASQHVLNTTTPTLILAAEHDWRCPPGLSEAYYLALKKIGTPTELVMYQNESHAYTRPRRTIDRMIRICRWFARYGGLPFTDDSAVGYPDQG